ncbi:MAG TPA: ATP-grasp domain-containing protein [Tenuifilaceae bacterium]|nr:ATP-grasp domain-containing protein [Tenuifilaceae bacterium]HPE17036.1 ATP-grasp domain-containing protein [Tenuifilaceae bacterium]HPJ44679.1 ATP-grasp domain-containing protein [Tenuifilaceae bacterium]HPQ32943.1 ATP-grasp domain-containing protein [Tenuifilaceae bacterium]HRX66761.1 ATP-grasp domain-containing protein [Tenuifilaceae bacterium]
MKSIILYNQLSENPGPDEADVLDQVNLVSKMLSQLNVEVEQMQFSLRLDLVENQIREKNPDFIFNLVESVNNRGSLIYFSPALLSAIGVPFTGAGLESTFITTSKTLAKERMIANRIPTSPFFKSTPISQINPAKKYIVKPVWEEGSLGLDEDCVFQGSDPKFAERLSKTDWYNFFVEEFIDGREFNLSVLAGPDGPQVLNPAEIVFSNYPADKPKVVGYSAKWKEDSFEYKNTARTFNFKPSDANLLEELKAIAKKCWEVFGLNGYARVDFRVDDNGQPWVLEVNANPCISPDSGFYAACQQAKIPFVEAIRRIVNDVPNIKTKL